MWVEKDGQWNDRQSDVEGYDRPFTCKKVQGRYLTKPAGAPAMTSSLAQI